MGRIQSLQVLRFLAALGVVWFHAQINFGAPAGHGAAGVDVFFVLSGAVMAQAVRQHRDRFLSDRLTRIFPMYWAMSALWLLMTMGDGNRDIGRLFTTATLLPVFALTPYLGPTWTLCYELVFYLSIALVLRGARPWWIAAAFVLCAAANLALSTPILRTLGSPLMVEFALGLLAGRLTPPSPRLGCLGVAFGVGIILMTPVSIANPNDTFKAAAQLTRVLLWGLPALLIVSGALAINCDGAAWTPFARLGDASYSLYLCHYPVILAVLLMAGRGVSPVLVTALCVAVCVPLHLWIEKPLLRLSRRAIRGRGRSEPAVADRLGPAPQIIGH